MSCRINRPDRRLHLTTCTEPFEENACIQGGVHRRPAGRPSPGLQPQKEGTCHTKIPRKNAHAGGGAMNALPPSASPAACVRGAARRSPRPIRPCAGIAAKSGARPSAQDARRQRRLAYHTVAETQNGAARLHATGAGGAIGHGRRLACARVAASNSPWKAARSASPVARRGVNASGNNMPRGVQLASAADAVRPQQNVDRRSLGLGRQRLGCTASAHGSRRDGQLGEGVQPGRDTA